MPFTDSISDPDHPIWTLAKNVFFLVALGMLLYFQASRPDETEFKVWIGAVITLLLGQGVQSVAKAVKRNKVETDGA